MEGLQSSYNLHQSEFEQSSPPNSLQGRLGYHDLSHGSNDSSSATLTSMMTIAKFPSLSDGDVHESRALHLFHGSVSTSASQQQFASVQSLTLAGQRFSGDGEENDLQQQQSAPGSEQVKRAAPRFNIATNEAGDSAEGQKFENDADDPVLHAIQEKRSTEIIL